MFIKSTPLSQNQARYLRAELLSGVSYHLPVSFYLSGDVNIEQLQLALLKLTQQHSALRTRLIRLSNGEYQQCIADGDIPSITVIDADDAIKADPKSYIETFCFKSLNLHKQSLMKCLLIKLDAQQSILTLSLHHLIADGYSLHYFINALNHQLLHPQHAQSYSNYQQALLHQEKQFNTEVKQSKRHWDEYLKSANDAIIPSDFAYPNVTNTHDKVTHMLSFPDIQSLLTLCSDSEISTFHLIYSLYLTLLARHTGDLVITTAFQSHGRQNLTEHSDCIGLFARTLALNHQLNADLTVLSLAKNIQHEVSQAIQHQSLSYDMIISKCTSKPRFAINQFPSLPDLKLNGMHAPAKRIATWHSDFDLNLHIESQQSGIALTLFFNASLYSSIRADTMLEQIVLGLKQVVNNPNLAINELTLSSTFKTQVPTKQDEISNLETTGSRIEYAFFGFAEKQPERIAIYDEQETWSYQALAQATHYVGHLLHKHGVNQHKKIAILCSQSPLLVIYILASLRLGASFCVLDPNLPTPRLKQLLKILRADCIVSDATIEGSLNEGMNSLHLHLEELQKAISNNQVSFDLPAIQTSQAKEPAYYLFTSGTTGAPKCVVHTHAPLIHHIAWQQKTFALSYETKVTMLSGLMHDPLLRDIFVPLSIGGSLCIPSPNTLHHPSKLTAWLHNMSPNVMHTTPSMLLWLQNDTTPACQSLALCLIGGEPIYPKHIKILNTLAPQAKIVNVYGTTETPQVMAWQCVSKENTKLITPVGQAVDDVAIEILSSVTQEESPYTTGEVIIKTPYLSAGYLDKNGINEAFGKEHQTYHTGDLGYWNAERQLIIIGRLDDQIKVRGFRVSLSEIEQCLSQCPDIAESACLQFEGRLVLAVAAKSGSTITEAQVNKVLQNQLPDYLHVNMVMILTKLPRLSNRKPDKQALYALINTQKLSKQNSIRLAETDNEIAIAEAWSYILSRKFISTEDSFISLGGDSLSFIQASLALERVIGFVPSKWQHLRICELATMTQPESWWAYIHPAVIVRAISIVFILVGHFFDRSLSGGTDALFLVAGYSFAGFQLKTIELKQSIQSIFYTIVGIAIPTLIISLIHFYKIQNIDFARVFFFGNFILPFNTEHEPQYELYWFIDVLVQILLVLAVLFSFSSIRTQSARHPLRFAGLMLIFSVLIALISSQLWDTSYLLDRVPQAKLWLFLLGWGVYFAYHQQQKHFYALLALGLPLIINSKISPLMSFCALLLLYVPHIKIPKPFHTWVYAIASASLMIYLTHFQLSSAIGYLGINDTPYAELIVGLLGGITLWKLWQWVLAKFKQYWLAITNLT